MDKKEKILYLECNTGISGDMMVGMLLDLGADEEVLKKVLKSIPIQGFDVKISRVKKAGLDVCDFSVKLDEEHENHDHDMEYLYGNLPPAEIHEPGEHPHEEHPHEEHHHEGHPHEEHHHEEHHHEEHHHEEHHHEGHHHHEHRNLPEILRIIEHTDMTKEAGKTAERIFRILAKAEAKAHGVTEEEVHFHEVGAVDSIVDVIAAAVCLDNLNIGKCIVPKLCEGTGSVRCQHGVMPVPVPAVVNIARENHLRLSITEIRGELVTPTGAAIVAAIKTSDKLPKEFTVQKTGMGAGKRAYERPGILRGMLIEKKEEEETENTLYAKDEIVKLETGIDDCSGEALGFVMEKLLEAGAKDVYYIPIYMKKNRPAYQLNVICGEEKRKALERIIFEETTTIGIRRQKMERTVLPRHVETVVTSFGEARVKVCELPEKRYYPEYDSIVRLCKTTGLSYQEIYELIIGECKRLGFE